jgi:hypothetical protein
MAEAAVEVTLDPARQLGRVLFEPARECAGAGVQFAQSAAVRTRGSRGSQPGERVGIVVTPALPSARVAVDPRARAVTVEIAEVPAPAVVVLVPEDTTLPALVAQTEGKDDLQRAEFQELPPGSYLLVIYDTQGSIPDTQEASLRRLLRGELSLAHLPQQLDLRPLWEDLAELCRLSLGVEPGQVTEPFARTPKQKVYGACIVVGDGPVKLGHRSVGWADGVDPAPECVPERHEPPHYAGFVFTRLPDPVDGSLLFGFGPLDFRSALIDGDNLAVVCNGRDVFALVRTRDGTQPSRIPSDDEGDRWMERFQAAFDAANARLERLPPHRRKSSDALALALQDANRDLCEELGFTLYGGEWGRPLYLLYQPKPWVILKLLDDLQCQSISQIAEAADKLRWAPETPSYLPAEVTASLPRFERAAQFARQYLALRSSYRREEALSRALEEIEDLFAILVAASAGKLAPRLLEAAVCWRGLLKAELAACRAATPAHREIPNPFVFGDPLSERDANVFTGRHDIVQQIEASVLGARHPPTLVLHGPRRMGKTSILKQLPRLLGPDFAPGLLDCQNPAITDSLATLLAYQCRAIHEALQPRFKCPAAPGRAALGDQPFAVVDDWLDEVERQLPPGVRVLLCLDEYERLQTVLDAGWGGRFLDYLRHLLQHRNRLVLLFTGSHTFEQLGPAWTSRFLSVRRIRVSFLARADVLALLKQPLPEFDMTYAPGALSALLDATAGQPFLTQAVAFELVGLVNEHRRREATPADVEEAIGRAMDSAEAYFANVWSDAGERGQALLSALARGEPTAEDAPTRRRLREQDVLNEAGGFAVPVLERWVRLRSAALSPMTQRPATPGIG